MQTPSMDKIFKFLVKSLHFIHCKCLSAYLKVDFERAVTNHYVCDDLITAWIMCLTAALWSLITVLILTVDMSVFRPLLSLRLPTCVHNSVGYNKRRLFIKQGYHFQKHMRPYWQVIEDVCCELLGITSHSRYVIPAVTEHCISPARGWWFIIAWPT